MKRVIAARGGETEAAWLDKWVTAHFPNTVQAASGAARAEIAGTLASEAEEEAKRDGLSMRPALRVKGYSTLSDYFHDILDDKADD